MSGARVEVGLCPAEHGGERCIREEGHRGRHEDEIGKTWRGSEKGRKRRPKTPEYQSWQGMRRRCERPQSQSWEYYGARGITVFPRWRGPGGFKHFLEDMGRRPGPQYSLGRIDNDGHYTPENCRWETPDQQVNNRTVTVWLVAGGRRQTAAQWARETGLHISTILYRLKRGWTEEEAVQVQRGRRTA